MAQLVENLSRKCEALNSTPRFTKKTITTTKENKPRKHLFLPGFQSNMVQPGSLFIS
jgi:hypothetical protein